MNQPQIPVNQAPMGQVPINQTPMGQMNQPQKPAVSKWLWITLIVIAVLGGFFVAWYLLMGPGKTAKTANNSTPTSTATPKTSTVTTPTTATDATTNWKTYTSANYVYSIKYPQDWNYSDDKAEPYAINSLIFLPTPNSIADAYLGAIDVENYALDQAIAKEKADANDMGDWTFKSQSTTTIGGVQATKLDFTAGHNTKEMPYLESQQVCYLIEKNSKVYRLDVFTSPSSGIADTPFVTTMLSTFQFTK